METPVGGRAILISQRLETDVSVVGSALPGVASAAMGPSCLWWQATGPLDYLTAM